MKISVVIPAYNEENYIGRCLTSLAAQDFRDFEIIVVDNNSTDKTAEIAKSFGVKVVFEAKRGVCQARQTGTLAASGDIIVSTDADCIFAPQWLNQIERAFTDSRVVAAAGTVRFQGPPSWIFLLTAGEKLVKYLWRKTGKLRHVFAANLAFKKDAWLEAGGYNTKLTQAGDEIDMLKKLVGKGQVALLPDCLVSTSSRRLRQGFLYNVFVTMIVYYFGDYYLSRLAGRSLFGSYPPIRREKPALRQKIIFGVPVVIMAAAIFMFVSSHTVLAKTKPARYVYRELNDARSNLSVYKNQIVFKVKSAVLTIDEE